MDFSNNNWYLKAAWDTPPGVRNRTAKKLSSSLWLVLNEFFGVLNCWWLTERTVSYYIDRQSKVIGGTLPNIFYFLSFGSILHPARRQVNSSNLQITIKQGWSIVLGIPEGNTSKVKLIHLLPPINSEKLVNYWFQVWIVIHKYPYFVYEFSRLCIASGPLWTNNVYTQQHHI